MMASRADRNRVCHHKSRQFEFVKSQWVNDGYFISAGHEKDPIADSHAEGGKYTYPS
jgi:hypothetical protein